MLLQIVAILVLKTVKNMCYKEISKALLIFGDAQKERTNTKLIWMAKFTLLERGLERELFMHQIFPI